jgi:molybdate transport system substrate-binding protein
VLYRNAYSIYMPLTRRLAAVRLPILALLLPALLACSGASEPEQGPVVLAASSLQESLEEAGRAWAAQGHAAPVLSFAGSSALARQVEQGAPADLFISADLDWMDYAAGKNLIKADTRFNLLGNKIVLIAPRDSKTTTLAITGGDLARALAGGKLSMGNVDAVPAGKYGKAALEKLGAWAGVATRIAQAENVRAALLLVSRGEAPAGIVYQTDAAADANVRIVGAFPEDTHPAIVYPVALTASSANPDAAAFVAYLRSAQARAAFEKQGFTVLK